MNIAHAHVIGFPGTQKRGFEDIAYWAYDDGWYVSPVLETGIKERESVYSLKSLMN